MTPRRIVAALLLSALLGACGGGDRVEPSSTPRTSVPIATVTTSTTLPIIGAGRLVADDVAYATASPAQRLDVYVPSTGGAPFPTVVFIHGGGWSVGDKRAEYASAVVPLLVAEGYAVASVNYRLSTEAGFPAQLLDVKAAVRWLRGNAASLEIDGDRIAASGESAGAHLAALLGTSAGVPELDDPALGNADVSSSVQAVVDLYGPVDLVAAPSQLDGTAACREQGRVAGTLDPAIGDLLGAPAAEVPELAARANPITYVDGGSVLPPFFIAHGDRDCVVPSQGSALLDAALRAAGGDSTFVLVPGSGHYTEFDAAGQVPAILAFLARTIGT